MTLPGDVLRVPDVRPVEAVFSTIILCLRPSFVSTLCYMSNTIVMFCSDSRLPAISRADTNIVDTIRQSSYIIAASICSGSYSAATICVVSTPSTIATCPLRTGSGSP